ncbi:MAG: hypothetical protein JWR07_3840 [Nevskia sp.]|nr:hypothetical protein [Nevskia sp.]
MTGAIAAKPMKFRNTEAAITSLVPRKGGADEGLRGRNDT